jgi:hypothetical protein
MAFRWLVLAFIIAGCESGTFSRRPGQDRAESIVWNERYGMSGAAPAIEWMSSPLLGGSGGMTWIGWKCQVVESYPDLVPDPLPISGTRYAHELMHYRTWIRTGDVDPLHLRGDWNLADNVAVAALAEAGL